MRRFWTAFMTLVVTCAMLVQGPSLAYADIKGTDFVGSTTITDRNLTITETPTIDAKFGILCDKDGTVLWSRSSDEQSAMASITKIMTAVVALENADMDDKLKVSANAAAVGESSAELAVGDEVSVYNLLCGLLVHSGNDAGVVLAEGIAGNVDSYVELMNAKAKELGLANTQFKNPHGLDADGHYSTAADICVLSRYAMQNETFRKIVGMKKVTLKYGSGKHTFSSTNSLLNTWDPCIGVKTGYTGNAGYCLASAAEQDGIELYAVVLGCSDEGQRFTDSYRLFTWGFKHYRTMELAKADDVLVDAPVSAYTNRTVQAGVAEDVSANVLDYDGDISIDVSLIDLPDGCNEGDRVGTISWRQGEIAVASAPLVAKEKVGKPLAIISVWTATCRLVGWFVGDDCVADSVLRTSVLEVTRNDDVTGEEIDETIEDSIRKDAAKNA